MKIYVGHSSSIDFEKELYRPLKQSCLSESYELVLPHESEGLFDSKTFLQEEADFMSAEVSKASIGLGIELGWAERSEVPIICVYREGSNPSSSLEAVTSQIHEYPDGEDLISVLEKELR